METFNNSKMNLTASSKGTLIKADTYIEKYNQELHKVMTLRKFKSVALLNVKNLNSPIKRHRVGMWIKKYDPSFSVFRKPT